MSNWKDYTAAYDALFYTAQQKSKIATQAADIARTRTKKAHRKQQHFFGKIASAAACLLSVITITAEAAGIPTPVSEILAPIFGGSIAQTEVINKIGHPIDAYDTDNGVTIQAEAIIGDEYNACLVFTISRDDGKPILPEGVQAKQLLLGGSSDISLQTMGGSHGSSKFIDNVPGDHEIQWVRYISSDVPLNKGICKASFRDIQYCVDDGTHQIPAIEGNWKFRFEVDYEDSSVTLGNRETFQQGGMNFTINEVRVSPIALQVSYEVDSAVLWSNAPSGRMTDEDRRQVERYKENVEILLKKKDGTIIDMSNSGGSIQPDSGKTYCTKGEIFEEILPLEELESICIGGVLYSLE